jgi:translation initiation factor IF-2
MGWRDVPHAGDQLLEASTEDEAKKAITNRLREIENRKLLVDVESINSKRVTERNRVEREEEELARMKAEGKTEAEIQSWRRDLERGMAAASDGVGGKKELRLVIKGDVSGSVEAVVGSLEGIGNKEAGVKIVHVGVGEVGESDIHLAEAAGGEYSSSLIRQIG